MPLTVCPLSALRAADQPLLDLQPSVPTHLRQGEENSAQHQPLPQQSRGQYDDHGMWLSEAVALPVVEVVSVSVDVWWLMQLEKYSKHLEQQVEKRTEELMVEKERTTNLLYSEALAHLPLQLLV